MARPVALLAERHRKRQQILCLPPATGELPETGGVIVASPACPTRKQIEHAGHIYQEKVIKAYSINAPEVDDSSQSTTDAAGSSTAEGKHEAATPTRPAVDAASSLASKLAVGSDDLYELLELGEKRWHATADDIKKSFRRISLTYHPDKIAHLGEKAREDSEAHFKAVMKAYDILSDKKKRAAYDSIDDVDDSIPTERDATASPARFYEKFGECFALNSRWSISNRVPELGDDTSDLDSVNKFYDFWYSFKSWRDFSFDLEYDTDQAECREEKRWMDRQNAKHVKAKKLEESARIRRLVDLAFKHDPRLQRERAAAKAKKDAQKLEKQKAAQERARVEREAQERAKQEAERKEAEDKEKRAVAKKQKENARQVMRKTRQKLRAAARSLNLETSEGAHLLVEKICMEGIIESIEAVTTMLNRLDPADADVVQKAIEIMNHVIANPQDVMSVNDVQPSSQPDTDPTSSVSPSKATAQRNTKTDEKNENKPSTSNGLNDGAGARKNGPTQSQQPTSKTGNETRWTPDELSLLSKGVSKFPGGTRDRWQKLADYIGTKSPDEVLAKVNESRASKASGNSHAHALANSASKKQDAKAFERFQEKKKGAKPVSTQSSPPPASKTKTAAAAAGAATAPQPTKLSNGAGKGESSLPSQPPNKLLFTPKQQSSFEAALKKFPASEGEMRWKKVSNLVGRPPEDCKERFSELIAFFQARKQKQ